MGKRRDGIAERMGSARTSSLVAAESADELRAAVRSVVRRQGYLLAAVHQVVMQELLRKQLEAEAEQFNDEVKPMVDRQLEFDWEVPNGIPE